MSWLPQVFHWQSFTGVCDLHINNTALGSSFSCSLFLSPESSPRSELCSVLGGLAICWARMDQSHSPASSLLLFHLSLFFSFSFSFPFFFLFFFFLFFFFPFFFLFFFFFFPPISHFHSGNGCCTLSSCARSLKLGPQPSPSPSAFPRHDPRATHRGPLLSAHFHPLPPEIFLLANRSPGVDQHTAAAYPSQTPNPKAEAQQQSPSQQQPHPAQLTWRPLPPVAVSPRAAWQ